MWWMVNATRRPLYLRENPGTHCIGGWVGPTTDLDGCGKSRLHQDLISGLSSSYGVAVSTELPRTIVYFIC